MSKSQTPEEALAAARALVREADQRAADDARAAAALAQAERAERMKELSDLVRSDAWKDVHEAVAALAPKFMRDGAHVPYLLTALDQVAGLAPAA